VGHPHLVTRAHVQRGGGAAERGDAVATMQEPAGTHEDQEKRLDLKGLRPSGVGEAAMNVEQVHVGQLADTTGSARAVRTGPTPPIVSHRVPLGSPCVKYRQI
jgi:hypothetical protein